MITQVGYSVVGLSRGRVTPCAVRTMHMKMRSTCFLVDPNQARRFVSGLASKPLGWFLSGLALKQLGRFVSGLASKPLVRFLLIWPQNQWWRVFWFGLQN
jgi:hypothetical protein